MPEIGGDRPVDRRLSPMVFAVARMSRTNEPKAIALSRAGHVGIVIGEARRARGWTLRDLSKRCGLAVSSLHAIEHGRPASIETYASIARALGLELRLDLVDPRRKASGRSAEDPVHAAMGEIIAERMSGHRFGLALDEPYQHYQFAGRADLLAWDLDRSSLLHVENRTGFPNLQDAIGSYAAKRRHMPQVLAERLGVTAGFACVTNVIVALWSSEVLHAVRLRRRTFEAVCPDDLSRFESWWSGAAPERRGSTSSLVLLDPGVTGDGRVRAFVGLDAAIAPRTRPRYRGYADALEALTRLGRA